MHAVLDHSRAELPRRLLGHHPVEDQLHPVRSPQIQIVPNDFLEELAPPQRPVEDLRQAHFQLPDRQTPVVTGGPILRLQRQWQSLQPLAE